MVIVTSMEEQVELAAERQVDMAVAVQHMQVLAAAAAVTVVVVAPMVEALGVVVVVVVPIPWERLKRIQVIINLEMGR